MTPVLGLRVHSMHHGGRPLSLVCSISIGEGRYTIQFARAILVIFAATTRATPISPYIAAQGWMTPVLGRCTRSPHHGGRPLCLVCSDSSGEGRYTIQFARPILVIFAASTRATPISPYTAAQGWMTPVLGQLAPSSHHGG
jgi:hypothetical protein